MRPRDTEIRRRASHTVETHLVGYHVRSSSAVAPVDRRILVEAGAAVVAVEVESADRSGKRHASGRIERVRRKRSSPRDTHRQRTHDHSDDPSKPCDHGKTWN